MDYLILLLVFGGIFLVFAWGEKRNLWKNVRNNGGCCDVLDREQAQKDEEEAKLRRRARQKTET